MSRRVVLVMATAASVVLGSVFMLSEKNPFTFGWNVRPVAKADQPQAPSASAGYPPADVKSVAQNRPPPDNPVGFMLAKVAEQYEDSARYPPWSVPLTRAQAQGYRGNRYEPVILPLENGGEFTVSLEKYRFTRGEDILVLASIQGPQIVGNSLHATLERTESRQQVNSTTLQEDNQSGYYQGVLRSNEAPGEYRLLVEASVDGQPLRHVSGLTIEPYLGEFDGLDTAYISHNNLIIPVRFSPDAAGVYALSAQLYHGQQPIAQLQAEKRLDSVSDTLPLKAHGTVLASKTLNGPLHLRNLQIRQLPAQPGERTHYGYGPKGGYTFEPPDLDALQDTPAPNPESEQRAVLLKRLADKF